MSEGCGRADEQGGEDNETDAQGAGEGVHLQTHSQGHEEGRAVWGGLHHVQSVPGKSNAGIVRGYIWLFLLQLVLLNELLAAFCDGLVVEGQDFSSAVA